MTSQHLGIKLVDHINAIESSDLLTSLTTRLAHLQLKLEDFCIFVIGCFDSLMQFGIVISLLLILKVSNSKVPNASLRWILPSTQQAASVE